MIRLLGAITGSALALATLLVFVGVPQFKFESTEPADLEQTVMTLPLPTEPVEPVIENTSPPEQSADPAVSTEPSAETPFGQEPIATPTNVELLESPPEMELPTRPLENAVETEPPYVATAEPDPMHWYAFWSPFRSEIAAAGFVDQLERVTGLDYRVVKLKPGVYEVAFAYMDDAEIAGNLSRITAATGLEMPEG